MAVGSRFMVSCYRILCSLEDGYQYFRQTIVGLERAFLS